MKEIVLAVDVVVEPDDPGHHAYAPAFKGLHVDGDTVEEALENARGAIDLYVQDMIECGEPIPVDVKRLRLAQGAIGRYRVDGPRFEAA